MDRTRGSWEVSHASWELVRIPPVRRETEGTTDEVAVEEGGSEGGGGLHAVNLGKVS